LSRLAILGFLGLSLLGVASAAPTEPFHAPAANGIERLPSVEPPPAFELPFLLEQTPPVESVAVEKTVGEEKVAKAPEKKDAEAETDKKEKTASAAAQPPSAADPTVDRETDYHLNWLSPRVEEACRAWRKPWSGSFELGVDGSAGNSNTFNVRMGFDGKRKTEEHTLTFDLDYHKNTNESIETANRLFFDWRYERPYVNTRWTWFVQGTTTYDEFQPWDVQVTSATGFGYHLVKTETTTLVSRFGGGFSHEIGGLDDSYVPELDLGLEAEHQVTKRQKIKGSVEYYPDVTEFGEFRVVSKADWEVLLDDEVNLSLKFSVADRFQRPNPGGKLNDVDYSMVLLWKY
jgi:putative salt-induced outer membrane protein YdiY